jgi:hypothetical protein
MIRKASSWSASLPPLSFGTSATMYACMTNSLGSQRTPKSERNPGNEHRQEVEEHAQRQCKVNPRLSILVGCTTVLRYFTAKGA